MKRMSWLFLVVTLLLIILVTFLGPEEQSLGANVRVVYLHGAWVLTAEIAFFAAALAGLAGLVTRRTALHRWSAALGRTGIFLWITYLPLSLWAMQTNWKGLFLSEPRFRLALTFAVAGLLMQIGLWLLNRDWLTSTANIVFVIVLRVTFSAAANVMHPPPSPIFSSGDWRIIAFFLALNLLTLLLAGQIAWLQLKKSKVEG